MSSLRDLTRVVRLALLMVVATTGVVQASLITTSPDPFPPGSQLIVPGGACVQQGPLAGACTTNIVGTILSTTSSFPGDGNEYLRINEILTADLPFGIGHLVFTGAFELTLTGRAAANQTGVFPATLTGVDFHSTLNGRTVDIITDPSRTGTGSVSILPFDVNNELFLVDARFTAFSLFIIDGGPPIPVGPAAIEGTAVPEPAGLALLGVAAAAMIGMRKRQQPDTQRTTSI